jgi:hypothetical protein
MAKLKQVIPDDRIFFRDVKPYEAPDSLDELQGPRGGIVELPHSVLWAPGDGRVDLDEPGGLGLAYRAVIAEGTVADQVKVLSRDRLTEAWGELMLPRRVRQLWEGRFPELRVAVAAE